MSMQSMAETGRPQVLRVAAVWGTTVVAMKALERGQSFVVGESDDAILPAPDGTTVAPLVVRAARGGWEVDARGVQSGVLRLRGREEDPVALGHAGAPVPIVPGDYGLLQYGLFSIFFQYTARPPRIGANRLPEFLVGLALFSSAVFHVGLLGLVRALMTPPPIAKPLELVSPEEFAARFGLRRPLTEEPPPPALAETGGEKSGGSGVKDPGAKDKKAQGGGQKIKGAEGKLGLNGDKAKTEIPGEVKPTQSYGGLSEVLSSDTGQEIKNTLKTIQTVSSALGGLNSANLVLGSGPGTGLKGAGGGGGGKGDGVAFGAGTMQTGWGAGSGGGFGAGAGGPGGRGSGGSGRGGSGGGSGVGTGTGSGEAKVAVSAGSPTARGGLSSEQVRRVVMAHTGALRACYESEAQRNPNLRGGVTLKWTIDPSGSVNGASMVSSTLSNPRVEGCVLRQVKAWHFPSASEPTGVEAYPFKFGVGG